MLRPTLSYLSINTSVDEKRDRERAKNKSLFHSILSFNREILACAVHLFVLKCLLDYHQFQGHWGDSDIPCVNTLVVAFDVYLEIIC